MEVAFVSSAIRRYWWMILVMGVLGLAATFVVGSSEPDGYTSRAVLLVEAPSDGRQTTTSTEADRYVKGQLTVLRSEVLAERVAERLEGRISGSEAARITSFEHEALTDVVHIVVTAGNPKLAQDVGNAYLDIYFESLRAQTEDAQRPEIEQLDEQIETVRQQLADVNGEIESTLAPFRNRDQMPTIEQVAPALASQRDVLHTQYFNILDTKNELNASARRVASEIVQRATLPTEVTTTSSKLLHLVGLVGGLVLGAFAAMVTARLSNRVLGDDEVETLLGRPLVGRVPYQRELRAESAGVVRRPLADPARRIVRRVCIRAAGVDRSVDSVLMVLVAGTRVGSGASTMAAAMARQFADAGARVHLVDAAGDGRGPAGRRSLGDGGPADTDGVAVDVTGDLLGTLEVSPNRELARAGLRRVHEAFGDLRDDAEARGFDVVVFDGGPLLESTVSVQLARLCHVVVLAVPDDQDTAGLVSAGRELREAEVLPIWTMRHQLWDRLAATWAGRLGRRGDGGDLGGALPGGQHQSPSSSGGRRQAEGRRSAGTAATASQRSASRS